jgi:hypothetical protein
MIMPREYDIERDEDAIPNINDRIGTDERPISVDEAKSYGVNIDMDTD